MVVVTLPAVFLLAAACVSLAMPVMVRNTELRALWRGEYGFSARFDPHSVELARRLASRGFRKVIVSDWGLHPQLAPLLPATQRGSVVDLWPLFNEPSIEDHAGDGLPGRIGDIDGELALVSFAAGRAVMPATERNREALLSAWGLCVIELESIADGRGRPLYELRTLVAGLNRCPDRISDPVDTSQVFSRTTQRRKDDAAR